MVDCSHIHSAAHAELEEIERATRVDCSHIHSAADRLAGDLGEAGYQVKGVSHSVNRNGGCSSYITLSAPFDIRLRVSDHSTSSMVGQVDVSPNATLAQVSNLFARIEEEKTAFAQRKTDELRARDEHEASYRQRYIAEPLEEKRLQIMLEIYPKLSSNKAARKEVRQRWLA